MSKAKGRGRPKDPVSKRSTNQDRHANPRKAFHAPQELLDALDRFIASTSPKTNLSETVRTAVEEFLKGRGFWPPKEQS